MRLTLKELREVVERKVVTVCMDNTSVLAYINPQGGTRLFQEAWELFHFTQDNGVLLQAINMAGKLNVKADWLFRRLIGKTQWSLPVGKGILPKERVFGESYGIGSEGQETRYCVSLSVQIGQVGPVVWRPRGESQYCFCSSDWESPR